jgi:hypothetical protein
MSRLFVDDTSDEELAAKRAKSSRIPDLLVGMVLPWGQLGIGGAPVNEFAALALCGLAALRRPRFRIGLLIPMLVVALWSGLAISSAINGPFNIRRMGHMTVYAGLVLFLGQGRIHFASLMRGLGLGLAIGIPLSIPSIATGGYAGRLTGLFGDPNLAGMLIVCFGTLAVGGIASRWRWVLGVLSAGAVVATFSRTSLLALVLVVVWALIARRTSLWLGLAILGPLAYVTAGQLESLRLSGPFAERAGSDMLRERINEAAAQRLATVPWYGDGPGSATVKVNRLTFFLHNSYDAVQLEGGILALSLLMCLTIFLFLREATGPKIGRSVWVEAALGAGMICALNLGEVLFELPFAVILGALFLVGSNLRGAVIPEAQFLQWQQMEESFRVTAGRVENDDLLARLRSQEGVLDQPTAESSYLIGVANKESKQLKETSGIFDRETSLEPPGGTR